MRTHTETNAWTSLSTRQRCSVISSVAATISEAANELTRLAASDQRTDPVETITGELLPLCSALRFIGRRGKRILRTTHHGVFGRPGWLWGIRSVVERVPHGTVLILGTWNYPLLLSGVQAAQAIAAGNRVILKPAIGSEAVTARMVKAFHDAGVPPPAFQLLDSSTAAAIEAIDAGVDLIVLTGAAATGRKVLQRAAETLTPTIMELSGCDAVVVMPGADIERAVDAIEFGLRFNGGATCIGPRRILVEQTMADQVARSLVSRLANASCSTVHRAARNVTAEIVGRSIEGGALDLLRHFDREALLRDGRLNPIVLDSVRPTDEIASSDLFAPVTSLIRIASIDDSVSIVNQSPYRLAASVFGPARSATLLANQLQVGTVTINDLIVPTADPRLPFGGRGDSGFGVTRGAEGLLAMTVPKVISRRRGKFAPHLVPRKDSDAQTLIGALQLLHAGTLRERWQGVRAMVSARKGNARSENERSEKEQERKS